jgi:RNA polymerase sigma-70 factor (ECF subfamily)
MKQRMKEVNLSVFTDDQLLLLLTQSDKEAFAAIYERYALALYLDVAQQLRARTTSEQAQNDTVHILIEVFLSLWNDREKPMMHKTLPGYLFYVADCKVAHYISGKERVLTR